MKLSIIIPVYNEAKTIDALLTKVGRISQEKEIIIVNDGSTDETSQLLEKYKFKDNIKIIHLKTNKGKGKAVREGIKKAQGDIIAIQDADLEYNPAEIEKLAEPILQNKVRVVYGSRMLNHRHYYSSLFFYLGGRTVNFFARFLYHIKLTDMLTGAKLFSADLIHFLQLKSNGFEIEAEFTAKITNLGIPILEMPISYHPRSKKDGKKIRWRDGVKCILTLIKYKNWQGH